MKVCCKCLERKEDSSFYADNRLKSGRRSECKACTKQQQKEAYATRPERKIAQATAWNRENKAKHNATVRKWYSKNIEASARVSKLWRENNPEQMRAARQAWKIENPARVRAHGANRRAAQLLRTPKWLTAADKERIAQFYAEAYLREKETGIPHHVDHILPLLGKKVSGLHVPENLRVVAARENLEKGNAYDAI